MENPMTPSSDTQLEYPPKYVTIRIKDVYGKETIYPVCETAQRFTALTGCTTIRRQDLEIIKRLGYTILTEQRELT
jgi:hypothetical protein